ncbi:MAG: DUF5110 domain-containing protein [Tannerella sp.]|nr:DUF5110 domain-containing protein [Tannerella sp.]
MLVGDRIAMFVPEAYDSVRTPSLILMHEPVRRGNLPAGWALTPRYTLNDGQATATVAVPAGTSLYGGGEVTGPLLRNGMTVKLWNTDNGAYYKDHGKRLYQSHPWVLGVRPDGTAFGVLFDSFWKAELTTDNGQIIFRSTGTPFRTYIIDRESPQAVVKGLAELTGTISMPPRWALGYNQCRFSYVPDARVRQIADTFRLKKIPCDVIWFDIDYMDGYRIFTINKQRFPDPKATNRYLHDKQFHSVFMIDPGVKVDSNYFVYRSGHARDLFVHDAYHREYHGRVWPGECAFPDFTRPEARAWWSGLYKNFLANGIDGIWNDMNEPSVFGGPDGTMPYSNIHLGGGSLPTGSHLMYHDAYGRLMVEATYDGMLEARPDKRPFVLSRANLLGGQRFAACWTGDNAAIPAHEKMSIPMSITLGLSGQPFSGPDIGGFLGNTSPDLFGEWMGFGAFFPFARGHATKGSNNKEPWAFGKAVENASRIALDRRYRLLPYLYTLFYRAHTNGEPVMEPLFFADTKDPALRTEQQAIQLGDNLLVIPRFAKNPALPKGIWERLSLVKGDLKGKYQATLKVRGGSIIPVGKVIQNTEEKSFDPLTLIVCPDAQGKAKGTLYWDAGDGWGFQKGDYKLYTFEAKQEGGHTVVRIADEQGNRHIDLGKVQVEVLRNGKTSRGVYAGATNQ